MDMKHLIHKRGVSLVLAFVMAVSCNFNIAAVDAGSADYVDSQNGNALQRVYDSGNVVLSNEIVPIKNDTYKIKLNINIYDTKRFLMKAESSETESQTGESVSDDNTSSASGVEKTENSEASAPDNSASQAATVSSSAPQVKEADSSSSEADTASAPSSQENMTDDSSSKADTADGSTSEASAVESASSETNTADDATVETSAAEKRLPLVLAAKTTFASSGVSSITARSLAGTRNENDSPESELEEILYEVRYYIQSGFHVVKSSVPNSAELHEDEHGVYVSWGDLSLNQIKNFTNNVQIQKDDSDETEPQTDTDENSEQISGLYQNGELLYAFSTASLDSDYYYVPVNLYKYNRDPVSPRSSTMIINQAAIDAVNNTKTSKRIRGISFDKVTSPNAFNGEWNQYNNAIVTGLVKNELDKNGNLQWGEGSNYIYVAPNLFGPSDNDTSKYRTDYTNVAFPLKKGDNGSYSFDSKELRAIYGADTNRIIPKNQDIEPDPRSGGQNAQFCPFYTKDGNPQSQQNRNLTYSFGMNMNMQFVIPQNGKLENGTPMTFEFSGDDDVWIFVDRKLVLDIGGIHQQKNGTIDFSTGIAKTTDATGRQVVNQCNIYNDKGISKEAGKLHTLTIFYLERGAGYSNFKMSCNLLQSSAFEIGKKLEGQSDTTDTSFHFNAKVGNKPFGDVPFDIYNVNGTNTGETGQTKANGDFYLKAGQKAVFSYSNPAVLQKISSLGTEITVQELEAQNYQTDYTVTITGQTPSTTQNSQKAEITTPDPTASAQTVNLIFTNKAGRGQLTIVKKIVKGQKSDEQVTDADSSQFFTFKIEQYASNAKDEDIEKSKITPIATFYEVIYTTNGVGSKTITNLPLGKYKVTEITESAWRYELKDDSESKIVSVGANSTLHPQVDYRNYISNKKWVSGKDSVTNVFKTK